MMQTQTFAAKTQVTNWPVYIKTNFVGGLIHVISRVHPLGQQQTSRCDQCFYCQ